MSYSFSLSIRENPDRSLALLEQLPKSDGNDRCLEQLARYIEWEHNGRKPVPELAAKVRALQYAVGIDLKRWEGMGGYYDQKDDERHFFGSLMRLPGLTAHEKRRLESLYESACYTGD